MRVFKYLFFALLFLILLFFAYGFLFLEDKVQVTRSITIDRPAKMVFKTVNSMHHFNKWSPWVKADPDATYQFAGPEYGVGSEMTWQGDQSIGTGKQTIIESIPHERIKAELYFYEYGDDPSWVNILITDKGESSEVTWVFDTDFKGNIMGRYSGMMMDRMLGPTYEEGLANLKTLVESKPVYDFSGFSVEQVEPQTILYVPASGRTDQDLSAVLSQAYAEITAVMNANQLGFSGKPMAITRSWDDGEWAFDAAIPVDVDVLGGETGNVMMGQTYGGKAVKYVQVGSYNQSEASYALLDAYIEEHDLERNGMPWEVYINDQQSVGEENFITHIYQPIK